MLPSRRLLLRQGKPEPPGSIDVAGQKRPSAAQHGPEETMTSPAKLTAAVVAALGGATLLVAFGAA